jgi:PAS domain S-box-containing protein
MAIPKNDYQILTGIEQTFSADDLIVTKTNKAGKIIYANNIFLSISGYSEDEVIGVPHNLIRHPEMPRAIFRLLWETIESGAELFAYVINRTKSGDHYWVFAHITPNYNMNGTIIGYHSSRRVARPTAVAKIKPIYQKLLIEETRGTHSEFGIQSSFKMLHEIVRDGGYDGYDRFVLSL